MQINITLLVLEWKTGSGRVSELRLMVLWQIFFKCFLLFKLEILLINQLMQQMLSSWGAAPGSDPRWLISGHDLSTRELPMCPGFLIFPLTLLVLRPFVMFLSNIYVVCPLTFPKDYWAGRSFPQVQVLLLCSASPSHLFLQLEFPRVPWKGTGIKGTQWA